MGRVQRKRTLQARPPLRCSTGRRVGTSRTATVPTFEFCSSRCSRAPSKSTPTTPTCASLRVPISLLCVRACVRALTDMLAGALYTACTFFSLAINYFEEALRTNPSDYALWNKLGNESHPPHTPPSSDTHRRPLHIHSFIPGATHANNQSPRLAGTSESSTNWSQLAVTTPM